METVSVLGTGDRACRRNGSNFALARRALPHGWVSRRGRVTGWREGAAERASGPNVERGVSDAGAACQPARWREAGEGGGVKPRRRLRGADESREPWVPRVALRVARGSGALEGTRGLRPISRRWACALWPGGRGRRERCEGAGRT